MKTTINKLFAIAILAAYPCPTFGEAVPSVEPIKLEKIEFKNIPSNLTGWIDKFIVAINDPKKAGDLVMLKFDLKSDFREIAIPEDYNPKPIEINNIPKFESKELYKVDNACYILVYDSKDSKPNIELPTVVWKMGLNSWHIVLFRDPLNLAIHKLNVMRAMEDIELKQKTN